MAIVTGDRYLDLLSRFVEKHAGALLDGSLVLKLNPVGLHYVQTRLEALHELESLRTGAPVDYLRAYIADLGDHRALEQLSRVLRLLPSVKVVSVLPPPSRDPSPITLLPFGRLRSLELRGCDLSTSAARGLLVLRPILEKLICHDSADALRHIFAERTVEVQDAQVWSRLTSISCAYNGMLLMDESLQLLPAVQFLDLSRNRVAKVANLHRCTKLKYVDLGFNHLRTISPVSQVKANLSKLVLRNNALVALDGIQNLITLEALDLSHNMISNLSEIELLAALPLLVILWLEGNPIAFTTFYREEVLSFFSDPSKVHLDGRKMARSENWLVSLIISKRCTQGTTYGSYAPAEHVTSSLTEVLPGFDEPLVPTATDIGALPPTRVKRKTSRLASIQEAQPQKLLGAEGSEQDGSPKFHCPHPGDVDEKTDSGTYDRDDVLEFMRKVEALRKDGSKSWLQELKGLLEENNEQSGQHMSVLSAEEGNVLVDSKLRQMQKRWSRRRRKRRQRLAEDLVMPLSNGYQWGEISERHAETDYEGWRLNSASSESSEVLRNDNTTEATTPHDSSSVGAHFGAQMAIDIGNVLLTGENGASLGSGQTTPTNKEVIREDKTTPRAADEELISLDESLGSSRVLDDLVESRASSGYPASPPHYHKDLLHKRHSLEAELLRFSFKSGCAPSSSDSDTSSDGSHFQVSGSSSSAASPKNLFDFNRVNADLDSTILVHAEQSLHQNGQFDGQTQDCELTNSQGNESATASCNQSDTMSLDEKNASATCSLPSIPTEEATEALRTGHLNPACTADILANAGGGVIIQNSSFMNLVKPNSKKKNKRARKRVVILDQEDSLNHEFCHTDGFNSPESDKCVDDQKAGFLRTDEFQSIPTLRKDASRKTSSTSNHKISPEIDLGIKNVGPGEIEPLVTQRDKATFSVIGGPIDRVEESFEQRIGDRGKAESCLQHLKCGCIRLWEESLEEREIFLLISSENKLYMLSSSKNQDSAFYVLASHNLLDVKKVTIGLGLQLLRIDIGHAASYLLVTRDVNTSKEILDMLSTPLEDDHKPAFPLVSWEKIQFKVFEESALGRVGANLRMYVMLFYNCDASREDTWAARSLFLTTQQLFLCMEDLHNFGLTLEDLVISKEPYFTIEAWANVYDLIEVVVGPRNEGFMTLTFQKVIMGGSFNSSKPESERGSSSSFIWRFKGMPDDAVSKLVALLRASHMEATLHPLFVKNTL